MTPSPGGSVEEFYVWACERCPLHVLLSLAVIERIEAEISVKESPGEAGGLLISRKRSEPGTIRIIDFIPHAGGATSDRFKLPAEFIAEAIARCPSDSKIAGYYRTDAERNIRLRPEDQETIERWFKDPASVFLVIASLDMGASRAGFFFREDQAVSSDCCLTFPFFPERLAAERWPIHVDSDEKEGIRQRISRSVARASAAIRRASVPAIVAVVSAVFALVIGVRVMVWNLNPGQSKLAASADLGLQVRREGTSFVVTWNPAAKAILMAKEGTLVIWDDSKRAWSQSGDPLYMPLTHGRLSLGVVKYNPFSFTENVKFRLEIVDTSGRMLSESAISVSPTYTGAPVPTEPAVPSTPGGAARESSGRK